VSLLAWLAFGAVAIVPVFESLTWQLVVYGLLSSLTMIRIAPVALALAGAGPGRATAAAGSGRRACRERDRRTAGCRTRAGP
jgi:NADH:ubiquinone oxidoreductase subunit H